LQKFSYTDFRQSLAEAVAGPRIHHQWRPDVVYHEEGVESPILDGLRKRGHAMELSQSGGRTQAIALGAGGRLIGVSDPRGQGRAAGE